MSILGALTLYNVSISSYSQVDRNDLGGVDEGQDSTALEDGLAHQGTGSVLTNGLPAPKLSRLQDDLFNLIQLVNRDPSEFLKVPSADGTFYPPKIPVSSVLLSFNYLISSPLLPALHGKRA